MKTYDVIIIGAGAAGLVAAREIVARKKSVLILDMGKTAARKVAVSGGGKCNFTNTRADWTHYFGQNPRFVCSALSQWTPKDTIDWVKSHGIKIYEKEPGRYFTIDGANAVVDALICDIKNTAIKYNTNVISTEKIDDIFIIKTDRCEYHANSVVVASGGISYPNLGISNIGHIIAKHFGHKIVPPRPGLCPIKTKYFDAKLAGISLPVEITVGKSKIVGDLLFTHFGIGGPAIYRATMIDTKNMNINFAPNMDIFEFLKKAKQQNGRKAVANILSEILPNKLAHFMCNDTRNIADFRDSELKQIASRVNHFQIDDGQSLGFAVAEVTIGGIACDKISSKTMESQICPGLYFAGEVMDITGDLGGFNIQWAFSSGYVVGKNA